MKGKALQVLLVEDNAGDARLLREMFATEKQDSIELTHLFRMTDALTHLAKGGVDVILLDMGLPDAHGLDTVRRTHAMAPDVPLIVITGLDDEALAAEAMKEGAQDYLIKGQIENRALPRALRHAIERHRMQTETDAIRTQQMQFKDEFLSHVSHELRSPLTAIHQFVSILLDKLAGELNPDQFAYLEIVLRNAKQLQSMINDLLEVTRLEAGKLAIELQCTSLSDAVVYAAATLQGAAAAKGIELSYQLDPGLPPVCADPTRLRQIFIILVDNAVKFTPVNGAVKIHACIFHEDSKFLILEVSDTGCGIEPEMTERIFERLFQVSDTDLAGRAGLGLGLFICKQLVMRQGGRIWARTPAGQGAVFSVILPVFSLAYLIAPSLSHGSHGKGSFTLVVTEVGSRSGWLSEAMRAEHAQKIRDLLRGCLHSQLDVLLPRLNSAGASELFFVVAFTDVSGAAAIGNRIQEQFASSESIQRANLTLSTSCRPIDPAEDSASEPAEVRVQKVTERIQEMLNEEILSRKVVHGQ